MMWTTKISIALGLLLAVTASFCICLPGIAQAIQEADQKSVTKLAAIDSITVSGEGDATELVIKISSPVTYTSYKTTAPLRLVVDLSQATQGTITSPLIINKGNFKTVTVSRYDTDAGVLTRVDIELVKDAEAIISAAPDQKGALKVSFSSPPAQVATADENITKDLTASTANVSSDSTASAVQPTVTDRQNTSVDLTSPAVLITEKPVKSGAKPVVDLSRALTAVVVKNGSIILAIEGGAGDFKTFRLNKPERFVIDLFDVKSVLVDRIVAVKAAGVASARLGLYPDKVRVVLDAVDGNFPEAVATKSDEGVTISLNVKTAADNPNTRLVAAQSDRASEPVVPTETKPAKPRTADTPAIKPVAESLETKPAPKSVLQPSGIAVVEMIGFQVIDGISRVSVKVSGSVIVETPVKTPGFVTLTIKNATLLKSLQRSLDSQGFVSPVLRITPLIVKTRKGTDTKIRIALRTTAPYEFKQEGDMLFVDFINPAGLTADKIPAELQEERTPIIRSAKISTTKETDISSEFEPVTALADTSYDSSKKYKGRKVTLEFADAEVRKIFQLLSEVSNKNFVLGDDVSGTISIKLVNVPWDQALDIIMDTKGLDKREDGNIVIIKGKGKFKSDIELEQENKKLLTRAMEMKTETFNVNYANIGDIKAQFEKLKQHERASITDDARTNKVIVRDIPQAIEDMRRLKEQLDVPERQVMIEARIVEATSTFTRSLGVNWGVHYRDGSASLLGINQLDTGFGGLTSAPPTTGTGTSPGGSMGISFGTLTSNIQLDMRLNAAASAGLIKIISSPKVATINNKTAKISQGQQIPYQNTTATTGAVTAFVAATLSLEVTPHINANGTIGMKIDAKNDAPGTGSPPPINTKQATTELLLKDGETTVIGGIYVDSDTEGDDGVPFLMDIPFLGTLFKTKNKSKTKTELLIFITPRILGTI